MGDDLMDFFNVRKEFKKVYLKVRLNDCWCIFFMVVY